MKTEVTSVQQETKVTEITDQAIQSEEETLASAITENEQFKKMNSANRRHFTVK